VNGEVIMYADRITAAMERAMDETARRRVLQGKYNEEHGITPRTVVKTILRLDTGMAERDYVATPSLRSNAGSAEHVAETAEMLRSEMLVAAEQLDFERAAQLRDRLRAIENGETAPAEEPKRSAREGGAKKKAPGKPQQGRTNPRRARR